MIFEKVVKSRVVQLPLPSLATGNWYPATGIPQAVIFAA